MEAFDFITDPVLRDALVWAEERALAVANGPDRDFVEQDEVMAAVRQMLLGTALDGHAVDAAALLRIAQDTWVGWVVSGSDPETAVVGVALKMLQVGLVIGERRERTRADMGVAS